jgi:hypothetical protein
MRRDYKVQDDSVTIKGAGAVEHAGKSKTQRGEDVVKAKPEAGRYETHPEGRERPVGKSTSRDSSGVYPQNPVDSSAPNIGPP